MTLGRIFTLLSLAVALAMAPTAVHGGTYEYTLTEVLGRRELREPPDMPPVADLHQRFASIERATAHFVGDAYVLAGTDGNYCPATDVELVCWYVCEPSSPKGYGRLATCAYGKPAFDIVFEILRTQGVTCASDALDAIANGPVGWSVEIGTHGGPIGRGAMTGLSNLPASDSVTYGYVEVTSATLTITGTPVPEPCGAVGLFAGLGYVGVWGRGVLVKRALSRVRAAVGGKSWSESEEQDGLVRR